VDDVAGELSALGRILDGVRGIEGWMFSLGGTALVGRGSRILECWMWKPLSLPSRSVSVSSILTLISSLRKGVDEQVATDEVAFVCFAFWLLVRSIAS
jgi:hypothetical protein